MGKVRYVKSADELRLAAKFDPDFLPSSTRQSPSSAVEASSDGCGGAMEIFSIVPVSSNFSDSAQDQP